MSEPREYTPEELAEFTESAKTVRALWSQPRDEYAEEDLLCAVLGSRGDVLDDLSLTPGDFFRPAHEVIYGAMLGLRSNGRPVEIGILHDRLLAAGDLQAAGGLTALHEISMRSTVPASATYYAAIIRERAARRVIIQTGGRLQQMAATPTDDVGEMVETARSEIDALAERITGTVEHDLQDDLDAAIDAIETGVSSLATPWSKLNDLLGGWRKGAVYVIAGRPGGGKSILGEQAAIHAMINHGVPAAFQSIEMTRNEIHMRGFAMLGEVNLAHLMRDGHNLGGDEWDRVAAARGVLGDTRFEVDDRSSPTVADIRGTVARCKRRHGSCGLLVVDYLQLIASAGKSENRQTEVAKISRAMKVLAKDLDIPVILLAQLNRGPEGEKRPPRPSDLRESGAVEQDADVVILLHRDEEADANVLHVGVGKNRHGPKGSFTLPWEGWFSRVGGPLIPETWSPSAVLGRAS